MIMRITPSVPEGRVAAIASKSQAHRFLICAALADSPTELMCAETSADIDATVSCLRALGTDIKRTDDGFLINPVRALKNAVLDCRESGSTLRFLLPVTCALGAHASFTGSARLSARPLAPLVAALAEHGAEFSHTGGFPLQCGGMLSGGYYQIAADVSSQFISGLLLALPMLAVDSILCPYGTQESRSYIEMTVHALLKFGVRVLIDGSKYYIPGGQRYLSPNLLAVEGDWSNAAFWLTLGAIAAENGLMCTGLSMHSIQGDRAIVPLLRRFGADVREFDNNICVYRSQLKAIDIDASDIPDLVPILAVAASVAEGTSTIYNAGRLRFKESDRLASVCDMLTRLGGDISAEDDRLIIRGRKHLSGGAVTSHNDHRIAMSAAVASSVCEREVAIFGADAVSKSYAGFFKAFSALGGTIEETEESMSWAQFSENV